LGNTEEQNVRLHLLRYYSTECLTHGTYLLSFLVVLASVIAFTLDRFLALQGWVKWFIVASIGEVFLFSFVYIFGRTLWWAYLINGVLRVKPISPKKLSLEPETKATLLLRIHKAGIEYMRGKTRKRPSMRFADFFSRTRLCLKKLVFMLISIVAITAGLIFVIYGLGCLPN
jgi:hypothetical protein